MIEPIMYIGIGFLVASLLVIGFIPMVHARAVRLTQRRLEAMTPMSMAEIHAEKDQLRAEFAMSTRRLEMSVEQMKAKTSSQLAELGKKSDAIGRLKLELSEKAAALLAAEAKVTTMTEELEATTNEFAAKTEALRHAERALGERGAEIGQITGRLNDTALTADSQRVELAAALARAEVLKGEIEGYEQEIQHLQARLDAQTEATETANALLAEERIKTEIFGARIKEFETQLIVQTTDAEILGRRVQELVGRLDEHERLAAERDSTSAQLHSEAASARKIETDLRAELAARESQHKAELAARQNQYRTELEALRAEKALADEQLRTSIDERERLAREVAGMKKEAENAWAAERMEAAVMRERINDVAAEVARLTALLEGPNSPIETILAGEAARAHPAGNGAAGENGSALNGGVANGGGSKGSLADRIRALQNRRTRVAQTG
jgi:chromosome segregation ATPase